MTDGALCLPGEEALRSHLRRRYGADAPAVICQRAVDSTNTAVWRQREMAPLLVFAAQQLKGRGTYGRQWYSAPGGLYFSYGMPFPACARVQGLALCCGLYLAQALAEMGANRLRVKWPNDLVTPDGKLGGVLAEVASVGERRYLVVGAGINVLVPRAERLERPAAGLEAEVPGLVDVDGTAARLAVALIDACQGFLSEPWDFLVREWPAFDLLRHQWITLHGEAGTTSGIARGIDANGALLVETSTGVRAFHAGEARLTAMP